MRLIPQLAFGIIVAGLVFGCAPHTKTPVMINGVIQLSKAVLKPTIVVTAGFQLAVLKVEGMT